MILEHQYLLASPVSDKKTAYVQNENGTYSLMSIDGTVILSGIQEVDGAEGKTGESLPMPNSNVFVKLENQSIWQQIDSEGKRLF